MSHLRKLLFVSSVLLVLTCGGCYTKVHKPESYGLESFGMTQGVKPSDMTMTTPKIESKKNLWNLWGLF